MTTKASGIKALIFDIDDTLFDRKKAQKKMLDLFRREYEEIFEGIKDEMVGMAFLEADRLSTEAFFASGSIDSVRIGRFRIFLNMLGIEEEFAEEMALKYIESYSQIKAEVHEAKTILETLAKNYNLGIVSNGLADAQNQKLESIGVKNLFDCVIISDEAGIQKPDPQIFWMANKQMDLQPGECLYTGNSYNIDILGAMSAGMKACWFNPDGKPPIEKSEKPDFEIKTLREILDILN